MDVKLAAAISGAVRAGEVTAFCEQHGISRQTFYKWKRRFEAEGRAGLEERSRRPLSSPTQTSMSVEDEVVRIRKQLADFGGDDGPWSIRQQLTRSVTAEPVPSEATIWRILVRRGLIVPEPSKRPRVSWHRFCWDRPNDLWQIDATHWKLADAEVEIINVVDDHARLCVASRAVAVCTSVNAWTTVEQAASHWGLPARMLSDNGLPFNGSRRGRTVSFEANLRAAGVMPIASTPGHPQTCGKVERFHQTLKQWLSRQPVATTVGELQTQLDTYVVHYNFERPHRALGGAVPGAVWAASPPAVPADHPVTDTSTMARDLIVNDQGVVRIPGHSIHVGVAYSAATVTVCVTGNDCVIFHNNQLVRALTINADRYYQPSGNPTGGPRHTRLNP